MFRMCEKCAEILKGEIQLNVLAAVRKEFEKEFLSKGFVMCSGMCTSKGCETPSPARTMGNARHGEMTGAFWSDLTAPTESNLKFEFQKRRTESNKWRSNKWWSFGKLRLTLWCTSKAFECSISCFEHSAATYWSWFTSETSQISSPLHWADDRLIQSFAIQTGREPYDSLAPSEHRSQVGDFERELHFLLHHDADSHVTAFRFSSEGYLRTVFTGWAMPKRGDLSGIEKIRFGVLGECAMITLLSKRTMFTTHETFRKVNHTFKRTTSKRATLKRTP